MSESLFVIFDFLTQSNMYDIVADCSDNVPTRYLVNDACVLSGKPLVSASALRMEGQVSRYTVIETVIVFNTIGTFQNFL